jgi:hypothetical protein
MPHSSAPSTGNPRTALLMLCVAAGGMGTLLALLPAAGHDQLWFLLMARRWLDGATLYGPQIFDSNPPAVVWLSSLPVLLGRVLHLPATAPAKLLVLLAESAPAALSYYFLRRRKPLPGLLEGPALLFAFLVLALVVPARDFGQRDQMLSFLVLPYVLAASVPRRDATLARCAAGVLAAAGICLKPQYVLIPIAVEAFLLLRPSGRPPARLRHLLRPEPILILLGGIAYLLAMRRFTPLYFTVALPILRDTYWAVGHLSLPELALEAIELCLLGAASILLFLRTRRRSPAVRLLLVAATAAAAAYFQQGTGWYYQQIPALTLFGAALALQLIDLASRRPPRLPRRLTASIACLSLLALALTAHFMGYPFTPDRAFAIEIPDPTFFTSLAPGTPVAILTTSVDAAMMPVERYRLQWAQRTDNLWLLPAILRSETPQPGRRALSPQPLSALETLQRRWMVEDLDRWHPQLVLVERCHVPGVHCQLLEDRTDNLLGWFLRDPAFAAAWQPYHLLRTSGPYDAYVRGDRPN